VTLNLSDYESGAKYKGDYEPTSKTCRSGSRPSSSRTSSISAAASSSAKAGTRRGRAGRSSASPPNGTRALSPSGPSRRRHRRRKARHFLWRFWNKLPGAGEIGIFDRSWYGRVLVERVEGFATPAQWRRGYDEINEFEAQQNDDGTAIVKLFFHITQETQDERLKARLDHPWKRWKVTEEDFRNRARRDDYLAATQDMFAQTSTRWAPWTIIRRQQQEGRPHRGARRRGGCARRGGADEASARLARSPGAGDRDLR
jgi:hypothetical protein